MIKVYLLYLKDNMELYAITDKPEYYRKFIDQRNKKLFKVKKVEMDRDKYSSFIHKNNKYKMCESCLYDGEKDINIIDTIYEEDSLDFITDMIVKRLKRIRENLCEVLNDKYLKVIIDATTVITRNDDYIQINTFELFYYLFKYTFINVSKADVTNEALNNIMTKEY